jgi:hypothetical protein
MQQLDRRGNWKFNSMEMELAAARLLGAGALGFEI